MIAQPFPHVVIDDFIDADRVARINAEWPEDGWINHHHSHSQKRGMADSDKFGTITRELFGRLNGAAFVSHLEKLTGIEGLVADAALQGGGLHETMNGGFLGIHADFNIHPTTKFYRRLNLLVFLNQEWREEWGGLLELWSARKEHAKSIVPIGGRAVLFKTTDASFHGHPYPMTAPEGITRRSAALYYYSAERGGVNPKPHSTLYLGEEEEWFKTS